MKQSSEYNALQILSKKQVPALLKEHGLSAKSDFILISPLEPFDSFIKINCENCHIHYLFVIRSEEMRFPEKMKCKKCGITFSPHEKKSRKHHRQSIQKKAQMIDTDHIDREVKIIDFSPGGVRIHSPVKINSKGKVQLATSDFIALGEVRWVKKKTRSLVSYYEAGISFEILIPAKKSIILDVVS